MELLLEVLFSFWPLLVTTAECIVLGVGFYQLYKRTPLALEKRLQTAPFRRNLSIIGLSIGAVGAFLMRLPDFQQMKHAKFEYVDIFFLLVLPVVVEIPIFVTSLTLKYTDRREQEVAELKATVLSVKEAEAEARNDEFFIRVVSESFLRAISLKRHAIEEGVTKRRVDRAHQPGEILNRYREAANPKRQSEALVNVVYEIFEALLKKVNMNARLRVAHFTVERGALKPRYCWDGLNKNCLKSPNKKSCKDRFKLNDQCGLAVKEAAKSGETIIVDDAAAFAGNPEKPFNFSDNGQEKRIKSLVAIPIGEGDAQGLYQHVICIDTDEVGFFNDSQVEQFKVIQSNLEQRLLCELHMDALLSPSKENA